MANTSAASGVPSDPGLEMLEKVRLRAFELYEDRGRKDGHDIDDWLLAEKQVTETYFYFGFWHS